MATLKEPFALDRSLNTTESPSRNIADVLAEELSRITGRNASQVEYDNTESGLTADNVQEALDEIVEDIPTVPSVDIQTAVDEFSTYNGGILDSLKVALTPNQDLHGYSEPWVGGSRKNKLPLVLADIKPLNTNGTWSGNVYTIYTITYTVYTDDGGNVTEIEANGTPTNNAQLNLTNNTTFLSGSFIGNGCPSGGGDNKYRIRFAGGLNGNDYGSQSSTMTADPNTAINVYIRVDAGITADHLKFYPMLRLSTESDPTFEPYSNICPISGHTQSKVQNHQKNLLPNIIEQRSTHSFWVGQNSGSTYPFHFEKDKSYAITFTSNYSTSSMYYAEDGGQDTEIGVSGTIFTPTKDMDVDLWIYGGGLSEVSNVQIELGSTATAYVPYNGYQVTVNLGGTYYSGTLDVVTGVFTPDTAEVDLGTLTDTYYDSTKKRFISSLSGVKTTSASDMTTAISSAYEAVSFASLYNDLNLDGVFAVSTQGSLSVRNLAYTDVNAFKTAMSGQTIVYPLATPTPIQLSPTMVKALVGENHLSAPLDGQEITESKYKQMFTFDDVIAYIQSLS